MQQTHRKSEQMTRRVVRLTLGDNNPPSTHHHPPGDGGGDGGGDGSGDGGGDGGVEMVYRAVLGVPLCVCVADQSSHVHAHTCKSRTFHEK